jgi:c-di-GMP-binding flagellar brake protein YcgR
MSLQSLVLCSDEKIVRILRRVLSDLEISMEHCTQAEAAIHKLTRQRFEAVIVDCSDARGASQVLRSARTAPCNKRAVAVAIADNQTGLQSAFGLGAHFVLYKPISMERAKASFRAARALMKRERRRNIRISVEIPVTLSMNKGAVQDKTVTTDLSEGGMAVRLKGRRKDATSIRLKFVLPGSEHAVECGGEVAWENASGQTGIRFVEVAAESQRQLKIWLNGHLPEEERDDPPVACRLTDLSLGGCYLEMVSPFPARSRVVLSMRVGDVQMQTEGVVRVMHPDVGMGVEFTQKTGGQREQVEKFIQALTNSAGVLPDLLVEPDGLDTELGPPPAEAPAADQVEDPLLSLFYSKTALSADAFLGELRRQRHTDPDAAEDVLSI